MKTKNLLLTFVLFAATTLNIVAQTQPPNAGFDNWVPIGAFENPNGWSSFNNFYSYGVPAMSYKTSDANSGFAIRLISETAIVPPPFGTNTLDTLAGFVFLGSADMSNPGISYTYRPTSMEAFVKGTIMPGGNAMIIATLRKWDITTHARVQVGMAVYDMISSIANYTQISTPFNYSLPDLPDTLEIKIMAGDVGPGGIIMPGNIFFVDDISFTFPVGISEKSEINQGINIFPNPTSDKVTISSLKEINTIEIYNMLGEKVYSVINFKNPDLLPERQTKEIDLAGFQKGIYLVRINSGDRIYIEKL